MLLITQSLNLLSASVGPIPTPAIQQGAIADGGGAIVIRRKRDELPKPEYKRQLGAIPLRLQYDIMLEEGLISDDEWLGILLLHGVNPINMSLTS